ncbi:MAG: D-alanyl-D-alanine carboxypeptidase/D-alanyl-D-alanine-endopeptidase [Bacteroidales bacterium]|nr:D-alanyl-D-alanine carboxypeptidase/D-alanyl-D-alanine-endopeptidase [Bacteroidales bacterium]
MRNKLYILAAMMFCMPMAAQTQHDLQKEAEKLAADPVFSHATVAISARTAGGRSLISLNEDRLLIPASNMKLISTGAALHALGPDYRYETIIGHDGEIIDGTLHGNLYIVGGGDPTLGSKDSIAVSIEKTFGQWSAMLKNAGIKRIEGHIVGDGRWLDGMMEEPTWMMNDVGTYYGSGISGLMFYENMLSFNVSAGKAVGERPVIEPYYPMTPWIETRFDCTTGEKGTGDRLYMFTSDLAPVAEIRGTFGIDRARKRVDFANKYPEYTCAAYFHEWLETEGIECSAGAADLRLENSWMETVFEDSTALKDLKVIGSTLSPSLARIAFETNHASNNLFAETLMRTLGKDFKGSSCYDSSYVALNDILKDLKVSTGPVQIQDGSGLSRQNYISPDFICDFLEAMAGTDVCGEFVRSLPSPGFDGSLNYNMNGYPATFRARIKVKSGSMNGVRCYSGYILPSGYDMSIKNGSQTEGLPADTIIFSIMTNSCTSPTWKVRPMLDSLMAAMARSN